MPSRCRREPFKKLFGRSRQHVSCDLDPVRSVVTDLDVDAVGQQPTAECPPMLADRREVPRKRTRSWNGRPSSRPTASSRLACEPDRWPTGSDRTGESRSPYRRESSARRSERRVRAIRDNTAVYELVGPEPGCDCKDEPPSVTTSRSPPGARATHVPNRQYRGGDPNVDLGCLPATTRARRGTRGRLASRRSRASNMRHQARVCRHRRNRASANSRVAARSEPYGETPIRISTPRGDRHCRVRRSPGVLDWESDCGAQRGSSRPLARTQVSTKKVPCRRDEDLRHERSRDDRSADGFDYRVDLHEPPSTDDDPSRVGLGDRSRRHIPEQPEIGWTADREGGQLSRAQCAPSR